MMTSRTGSPNGSSDARSLWQIRWGSGSSKVYENALAHELRKAGLAVRLQCGVTVNYGGVIVGTYAADLLVEDAVIVERKGGQGSQQPAPRPVPQLPEGQRSAPVPAAQLRQSQARDKASHAVVPLAFICVHLCSSVVENTTLQPGV
jgi:hypothetical protein